MGMGIDQWEWEYWLCSRTPVVKSLSSKIFEFFYLEMAYSNAFVMHNACSSSILSRQTEQICCIFARRGVPAPRILSD